MQLKRFTFNPFGESTYLLWDDNTKEAAVVDPGMSNTHEQKLFENFINAHNLSVQKVINTHLHLDHCWGNHYVCEHYEAKVFASEDDLFLGLRAAEQAQMFGIFNGDFKPITIDIALHNDDTIRIGNDELLILTVPGHSPGSIALYNEKDNFVIVGDALFRGSIGRTDLPGGDFDQLISSIKNKLFTLPDRTTVYSGHDQATSISREKQYNPYLKE